MNAMFAEIILQYFNGSLVQVFKSKDIETKQRLLCYFPSSPHFFDGQWIQKFPYFIGSNNS